MNERERRQKEANIEAEARKVGNLIRAGVDQYNASHPGQLDIGFTLMLFEFGPPGGFSTYISSATRETMIPALQELLALIELKRGLDDLDVK